MKPSFVIWLVAAPTLTGILITALLLMPSMADKLGLWITAAAAFSSVVAIPFSLSVGKAMQ